MTYRVKTEIFEGPLPVLLDLIEKRKLEINQISLAAVTEDFLNYVKNLTEKRLGDVSQFILVAAALILIKSKSLLPTMELSTEEESSIASLEERLRRFQAIKSALPAMRRDFGRQVIWGRAGAPFVAVFAPDPAVNLSILHKYALQALSQMPQKEFLPQVPVRRVVSLQDVMKNLIDRIEKGIALTFQDFAKTGAGDKKEGRFGLVVSFLALLELVNQGLVAAIQDDKFGEIAIEKPKLETIETNA
jgi:segregation and condensation protein A